MEPPDHIAKSGFTPSFALGMGSPGVSRVMGGRRRAGTKKGWHFCQPFR
jgi:hypothetical protein